MANDELKAAAQKELLRRKAKAELARRRGVQPATQAAAPAQSQEQAVPWYTPITSAPGDAMDIARGLYSGAKGQAMSAFEPVDTPMGKMPLGPVAGPLYKNVSDIIGIAKPIVQDPQGTYDAAAQGLDKNFGTPTRAWNTVAQNPVDALLMAAPGLGLASKGAAAANMPRLSSGLSKTAAVIDPVNYVSKPIEKFSAIKSTKAADKVILDAAPTQEQVAANAKAKWDEIKDQNIQFPAGDFKPFAANIKKSFETIGSEAAPAASALRKSLIEKLGPMPVPTPVKVGRKTMSSPPILDNRTVPFNDVNEIRKSASTMSADIKLSDTERKVAGDLKSEIDKLYEVIPGLNEKLTPAREMSRRNILAKQLGEMERKADWYVSGNESGLKNQINAFGKKDGKTLTEAETSAMKNVGKKEGLSNLLSTQGSRMGQIVTGGAGAALGGLPGFLGASAVHLLARKLSEKSTMKALSNAKKTVLLGTEGQQLLGKLKGRAAPETVDLISKSIGGGNMNTQKLLAAINKKNVSLKDKTLVRALLFSGAAKDAQQAR